MRIVIMSNLQLGRGAKLSIQTALLSSDFGLELFKRKAGKQSDRILSEIGVYAKGKNIGKYKGCIQWVKTLEGGFDYIYGYGVVKGGSFDYRVGYTSECEFKDCEPLNFDKKTASYKEQFNAILETWAYAERKYRHYSKLLQQLQTDKEVCQDRLYNVIEVVSDCKETLQDCDTRYPTVLCQLKGKYELCEV